MPFKATFKSAVEELRKRKIPFAVAGGLAADLYRNEPRLTMDADLVILPAGAPTTCASDVLKAIGLRPGIVRRADLDGGPLFAIQKKNTPPCMVVGRPTGKTAEEGVDLILPELPWVHGAIERAEDNPADFGFGPVPVLTIEDVLLSKLFAMHTATPRPKDLDDIQSIIDTEPELNIPYLAGQIDRLEIAIPKEAKPFLPDSILSVVKDVTRARKARKSGRNA